MWHPDLGGIKPHKTCDNSAMKFLLIYPRLTALLLGALCVFGFAPFYCFVVPILALAGLFGLWHGAQSARQAAWLGFIFGLGFFVAGIAWIYISLHDIGGMPAWMAGLATLGLCAFLALFHAAAGYLTHRYRHWALSAAIFWVLLEWLREWLFTGFPWLNVGYSQVPFSPLANLAPLGGILAVSLAVAISALWLSRWRQCWKYLLLLWIVSASLGLVAWTQPTGQHLSIALLQGNVAQSMKWQADEAEKSSRQYWQMAQQSTAKLVVMPETALPYAIDSQQIHQHPISASFAELAQQQQKTLLLGAIETEQQQYFNSMLALLPDGSVQRYRKAHLVPFGEFIPFKTLLAGIYRDWLHIPMSDLSRGQAQQSMHIQGWDIALNICYEDVFGDEIRRQSPPAHLLINTSNDAWYGHSLAAAQHLQFSQARALENGRWMLRATNTGVTAAIDQRGHVVSSLPQFVTASLSVSAPAYQGRTPYSLFGNGMVLLLLALLLLWAGKTK